MKYSSIVYSSRKGYERLKGHVEVLSDYEGFAAHSNALKLRDKNVQ